MKDNNKHQISENIIAGKNAVTEALSGEREIDSIYLLKGSNASAAKIIALAKKAGIPIKETTAQKLDSMADGVTHQGVVATVAAHKFATVEEILQRADGEHPFIIIADSIEDPHNLGAIIRTAEAAGAHGVIIPKRRGVSLTATVAKTSAGAIEHMPVARVSNLVATVKDLKKKGIWVYGADMDGQTWCQTDMSGGVALVIGSEGEGISRLLKEECDFVLSLPMNGKINSLNASVAAGILMYEVARQRGGYRAK
ncbi:MAG: 23S rRNA (guanosine(2251)-2'-O)-methyltransferase RlmB [Oscillospiraceae bacterium]|nr:23S rRNA (guanosine(2251)-2'-O)-methyltransferase RlmB [Oscillospiraceae bacterium]